MDETRLPITDHLAELRTRIIRILLAWLVGSAAAWSYSDEIFRLLLAPAVHALGEGQSLQAIAPAEIFFSYVKCALLAGFLFALPVIFWQVWQFFVPAVDKAHAKLIKYFVFLAWVLAVVGLVFGYFIVLPAALKFLLGFDSDTFSNNLQAKPFLTFCTHVELAMAAVWELPLFVVALTRLGIIKTSSLRKNRRLGYFLVVCLAVALPGVDPVTVFFETLPLVILFEASIWASVLLDRRRARLATAHA